MEGFCVEKISPGLLFMFISVAIAIFWLNCIFS